MWHLFFTFRNGLCGKRLLFLLSNSRYPIILSQVKSRASMWFLVFVSCFDFMALLSLSIYIFLLGSKHHLSKQKGERWKSRCPLDLPLSRNRISKLLLEASPNKLDSNGYFGESGRGGGGRKDAI